MTEQEIRDAKCPYCGREKRVASVLYGCVNRYVCECYNLECKTFPSGRKWRRTFILNEYPKDEQGNYYNIPNLNGVTNG